MEEKEIMSAYLLTDENALPEINLMKDILEQEAELELKNLKQEENQVTFKLETCIGIITLHNEPLLAYNLPHEHQCFLSFSLVGEDLGPLEKSLYLSQILFAAIQATPKAVGIYWENALLYHSKEKFEKLLSENTNELLPIQLWVNFQFYKHSDDKMSLVTTGLKAFSLKEVEVHQSQRSPEAVLQTVYEAVYYMIIHGNNFNDGETVSRDNEGVIRAHYSPSLVDESEEIIRLVIVQ